MERYDTLTQVTPRTSRNQSQTLFTFALHLILREYLQLTVWVQDIECQLKYNSKVEIATGPKLATVGYVHGKHYNMAASDILDILASHPGDWFNMAHQ